MFWWIKHYIASYIFEGSNRNYFDELLELCVQYIIESTNILLWKEQKKEATDTSSTGMIENVYATGCDPAPLRTPIYRLYVLQRIVFILVPAISRTWSNIVALLCSNGDICSVSCNIAVRKWYFPSRRNIALFYVSYDQTTNDNFLPFSMIESNLAIEKLLKPLFAWNISNI